MAIDSSIAIRQGIIKKLAANAPLTAIVPAGLMFGQTVQAQPVFPFIRTGSLAPLPVKAACVDGAEVAMAIHVFAKDKLVGGARVETAEDYAARIAGMIAAVLDGVLLTLPKGSARLRWRGSQHLPDPDEAGCFHSVVNVVARAITA